MVQEAGNRSACKHAAYAWNRSNSGIKKPGGGRVSSIKLFCFCSLAIRTVSYAQCFDGQRLHCDDGDEESGWLKEQSSR